MNAIRSLTECGLPGIGLIPFGAHMCHFYRSTDDLAATLAAFFAVGLSRGERCIWVTPASISLPRAEAALKAAGVDVDDAVRTGALLIRAQDDWYGRADKLDDQQVLGRWFDEEQRALDTGRTGLRITGDLSSVPRGEWDAFMRYEALVDEAFLGHQILALCTYEYERCGPSEVLDVVHRHACVLDRPDPGWRVVPRPHRCDPPFPDDSRWTERAADRP